jgi:hypothetical protein
VKVRKRLYGISKGFKFRSQGKFFRCSLDVPQLVKMADVAVVSSRYEGFSLTAGSNGVRKGYR